MHLTLIVCIIHVLPSCGASQANISVMIVALTYAQMKRWTLLCKICTAHQHHKMITLAPLSFVHTGMGSRGAADRIGPQRRSIERHRCYWGSNKRSLGLGGHPVCPCSPEIQVSQRDTATHLESEALLRSCECPPTGSTITR